MEINQNIKHIAQEDFKKIDINNISYVQLYNGEILMIDHPTIDSINQKRINNKEENINSINENKIENIENKSNTQKRKRKKNTNQINNYEKDSPLLYDTNNEYEANYNYQNYNYDNGINDDNYIYNSNSLISNNNKNESKFTLPNNDFLTHNHRAKSSKIKNERRILFNQEWRAPQDYDYKEMIKLYENIPERAKFWERESFDSTRSLFQAKRLEKNQNYYQNYMTNYKPIPLDSSSEEDDGNNFRELQNIYGRYEYNTRDSYNYPLNQLMSNQKDLYDLAFGPQISNYILEQYNYQYGDYPQDYWQSNNEPNNYQSIQSNQYNYDNYNQDQYFQNYQNDNDYESNLSYKEMNDNDNNDNHDYNYNNNQNLSNNEDKYLLNNENKNLSNNENKNLSNNDNKNISNNDYKNIPKPKKSKKKRKNKH